MVRCTVVSRDCPEIVDKGTVPFVRVFLTLSVQGKNTIEVAGLHIC